MFHIILNSSEEYIKYTAVTISSIVKNTDKTKKIKDFFINKHLKMTMGGGDCQNLNSKIDFQVNYEINSKLNKSEEINFLNFDNLSEYEKTEGYIFHILSDFVSDENHKKLKALQDTLSQYYFCKIQIHILDNKKFKELPRWGENASFLTYYRILLGEVLPENLRRCLCLDVDMLVLCDVRELFMVDLQGKTIGAVLDFAHQSVRSAEPRNGKLKSFQFNTNYFNAGFMLVDLILWRKYKILEQCLFFLKNYYTKYVEQDALNYACKDKIFKLPFFYNCMATIYTNYANNCLCEGEFNINKPPHYSLYYTRKEFENAYKNPKIIHYTTPKVWLNSVIYERCYNNYTPMIIKDETKFKLWWQFALNTPIFKDELKILQNKLKENTLMNYANVLSNKLVAKDKEINNKIQTLQNTITNLRNEYKKLLVLIDPKLESAVVRIKNQLSYRLGKAMVANSKSFMGYLKMPFTLLKVFLIYKKKQRVYKARISYNPNLKLSSLESYADFNEALKVKNHLSYKLGQAFLKGLKTWYKFGLIKFYFEAKRLEREFKKNKR